MRVNMYVTGLLMYYAGQIAHKLVDDLQAADMLLKVVMKYHLKK